MASGNETADSSWLPPDPNPPLEERRPWRPPSLKRKAVDPQSLTYLLVDEIVGDVAGLSLSGWPAADPKGRLRFDVEGNPLHLFVGTEAFQSFLVSQGVRKEERGLRVGDAFAVQIVKTPTADSVEPLTTWVRAIYDVTRDARYVAKLMFYGAITDKWSTREAHRYKLTESPAGGG